MTQIASDSLVLFKVRTPSPLVVEETTPAPTKQMIMEATGAKGTTQFETFSNRLVKSNHDSKNQINFSNPYFNYSITSSSPKNSRK